MKHKQGPTRRANLFTCVFGKQERDGFGYYKEDQTRNPRTCYAFFGLEEVHQVHKLLYEQDGNVWRLSTEKGF